MSLDVAIRTFYNLLKFIHESNKWKTFIYIFWRYHKLFFHLHNNIISRPALRYPLDKKMSYLYWVQVLVKPLYWMILMGILKKSNIFFCHYHKYKIFPWRGYTGVSLIIALLYMAKDILVCITIKSLICQFSLQCIKD